MTSVAKLFHPLTATCRTGNQSRMGGNQNQITEEEIPETKRPSGLPVVCDNIKTLHVKNVIVIKIETRDGFCPLKNRNTLACTHTRTHTHLAEVEFQTAHKPLNGLYLLRRKQSA